jgi:hypothetical protein
MIYALTLIALCVLPQSDFTGVVEDECAAIELNTFYDDDGKEIFKQWIFYEATSNGFRIQAWRLAKGDAGGPSRVGKVWQVCWHDGDTTRVVRASIYRETHSQYDPELRERSTWPKELRRGLTKQFDHPSPSVASDSGLEVTP